MTNPYAPPQAAVHDFDDAGETAVAADRSTRLGASILDGLIGGALIYIPFLIGALVATPAAGLAGEDARGAIVVSAGLLLGFAGFVVWAFLNYKYVKANGQSIGKKALGIKVVRRDGSPATVGRIFLRRNVVNMALGIIPLYGLVDALFIFTESRQCIHDKLADTIVIKA